MNECYFTFRSITGATQARRLLEKNGIRAQLLRTPEPLRDRGCSYSLLLPLALCSRAGALLAGGSAVQRCFVRRPEGWEELGL